MKPKKSRHKPTLALTLGDSRGVGAEIILKAWTRLNRTAQYRIYGHESLLREAAQILGRSLPRNLTVIEPAFSASRRSSKQRCGEASLEYIRMAVRDIQAGVCAGLVTAPICKEHIHRAACREPGHTELLARLAGSKEPTYLMMAGPQLKVVLITLHVPLMKVPTLLTPARVLRVIKLTHEAMRDRFGITQPRLAMAGLNPHASEGGLFGKEEVKYLEPVLKKARRHNIDITGPVPGDTVFHRALQGDFDVVLSPYHDQGLIPVKLLHFEDAVNMTLGLPFVRTSVDHGVAFDIAWQGKANPNSLMAAGEMAARLV